jgi:hypothetical protein
LFRVQASPKRVTGGDVFLVELEADNFVLGVTLRLDEKWSSHQTRDELTDYIKTRLDTCPGYRGHTEKLKVVE